MPADNGGIDADRIIPFPALRRAPLRKRLWLGAAAVALFLATVFAAGAVKGHGSASRDPGFGLDFIAFYTAGTFVHEGRHRELYRIPAVQAYQHDLARQHGVELGKAVGPWWNPPFYAWVFSPLARLSFPAATAVWITLNIACVAAAAWLLVRLLPPESDWRTWALVPILIALSVPFIHCVTHGQNTGTSLLLLTLVVLAWRSGRSFAAGLVGGLLFYQPQLAAVLSVMLVLSLGWRAVLGLAVTGGGLLVVTLLTLPGSLGDFLHRMPANVHFVQDRCVYLWERHATFKAFWRLLVQGRAAGDTGLTVITLTALSMAAVGVALVRVSPLGRRIRPFGVRYDHTTPAGRDRLIAATVAATPLLMPFYFDYDLLLLAVPATLFAADALRCDAATRMPRADRWLLVSWAALYGWMLINADVAEHTRVNLAVPLLATVAGLLVARAMPRKAVAEAEEPPVRTLAAAA